MSAFLRLVNKIVSFADSAPINAPAQRLADWTRDVSDIVVNNPRTEMKELAPGEEVTIFDGTKTLTTDGTTAMSLTLVPGFTDRYRLRHTGGTSPGFRTNRSLNLSGGQIVVALNPNGIATMTLTGGPTFAGVVVGDTVYIPGLDEVGTQPFTSPNQGFWVVVGAASGVLSLTRSGDFEAVAETVNITAANQLQAFSAAGVQPGNRLEIVLGFSASSRRSYPIVAVTATYLEFTSTLAIAEETGILPTANGIVVYTAAKKLVYIEADQDVALKFNGDSSELLKISPWIAGDDTKPGTLQKTGASWSLKVLNKSLKTAKVVILSVE